MKRLVAVLVVVLVATWLLLRDVEADRSPSDVVARPPVVPTRVEQPARSVEVRTTPAVPVVAAPTAGGSPGHDVRVRVVRAGQTEVGARVELSKEGVRASGVVNVMGDALLSLTDGAWVVHAPHPTRTRVLLVTPDTRDLTLELTPSLEVRGEVVDLEGHAVGGVDVELLDDDRVVAHSTSAGAFSATLMLERARLRARRGTERSNVVETALPATGVKLVLEPQVSLRVKVLSACEQCELVVRHKLGLETCRTDCALLVPRGELTGVVIGTQLGATRFARFTEVLGDQGAERELTLKAPPPLTGVLKTKDGRPLPGVTVRARGLGRTGVALMSPLERVNEEVALPTNAQGKFKLWPLRGADLFFGLTLDGPWHLEHPAVVALGDDPLELVALPGASR